jgi:hypothetical protein
LKSITFNVEKIIKNGSYYVSMEDVTYKFNKHIENKLKPQIDASIAELKNLLNQYEFQLLYNNNNVDLVTSINLLNVEAMNKFKTSEHYTLDVNNLLKPLPGIPYSKAYEQAKFDLYYPVEAFGYASDAFKNVIMSGYLRVDILNTMLLLRKLLDKASSFILFIIRKRKENYLGLLTLILLLMRRNEIS